MSKDIEKYKDLFFTKKALAHVAITRKNGTPHVTPVWFDLTEEDFKNGFLKFNSAKGRVKTNNLLVGSKVSISILDPEDAYRYIGLDGEITEIIEGKEAENHIHSLSQKYRGKEYFDIPENQVRVKYIVKINNVF